MHSIENSPPDHLDSLITKAAKKRNKAKKEFNKRDNELKDLLIKGKKAGKGPSHMARLSGFTREWVTKLIKDD